MLTRRKLLRNVGLGAVATTLPALSFARADADVCLVLVILRGALDGLAVAAPYGDSNYRRQRGELALDTPGSDNGLLKLDGLFGLNPALKNTYDLYRKEEALVVHAVASPYRERSHFDGQDVLDNAAKETG